MCVHHRKNSDITSLKRPNLTIHKHKKYIVYLTNYKLQGQGTLTISMYCPKEDKKQTRISRFPNHLDRFLKCPHYLEGQHLGIGHIYNPRPKIINGRPVYGNDYVRFFAYAAQKYKFHPWFSQGSVKFFLHNNTFGGLHASVSKFSPQKTVWKEKIRSTNEAYVTSLKI